MFLITLALLSVVFAAFIYLAKDKFYKGNKELKQWMTMHPKLYGFCAFFIDDIEHTEYEEYAQKGLIPYGLLLSMSLIFSLIWTGVRQ